MMKKALMISFLFAVCFCSAVQAQEKRTRTSTASGDPEFFGNTLNLGIGLGYYGYVGQVIPVVHADFEIQVVRNFTLAPFISMYSFQRTQYWGNHNNPYRIYTYREVAVPIGVKASYYFDELLKANAKWDFYAGNSIGFTVRQTTWEAGYDGETNLYKPRNGELYLDFHAGAEFHMTKHIGMFLDLSTGVSTFGLGFHL